MKNSFLKTTTTSRIGFTLLELLIVISIIGILIALASVSFTTAQQKGRDAKRRGDIKAMQNAFEQYYANSNGAYGASCATMQASLPGGLPVDPKTGAAYTCNSAGGATTGYCVCADLEGVGGNATALPSGGSTTCTYGTTNAGFFCLSNLQ